MKTVDPYIILTAVGIFGLTSLLLMRFKKEKKVGRGYLGLLFSVGSFLLFACVPLLVMFLQVRPYINPVIVRVSFIFTVCFGLFCLLWSVLLNSQKLKWYWKGIKALVFWSTAISILLGAMCFRADNRPFFLLMGKECDRLSIVRLYFYERRRPHWKYSKYYVESDGKWLRVQLAERKTQRLFTLNCWGFPLFINNVSLGYFFSFL